MSQSALEWTVFTSHVLCHDKDKEIGKKNKNKLSCTVTAFLIEGQILKREINNAYVKQSVGISDCRHVL